ncbi:MAG: T9SS type A sorting domain-containing protein, partial [Ignavibacteria bacterium]
VGNYTIMNFVLATTLPDLTPYNTIILQETSFDVSGTIALGAAARTSIKNWLTAGTPTSKHSLISIGADQGYNYSRSGATQQDLEFADTYCKFVYRVDNAPGATSPSVTGITIDAGNTRPLTSAPAGLNFWPDGCTMSAGGTPLYKYQNHSAADTLAAIGNVQSNYVVATIFQDPRYFTGGFGSVLAATIGWVVSNGGLITGVGNNNVVNNLPDNFKLSQNYPNPFNPTTKISFNIPKSGLVTLKIYDMVGKEVATLVNEVKNIGNYEVEFNGSNLSSGTYFYRMESTNFVDTKKMILIK